MIKKGQNLRVMLEDKCLAASTSCKLHVGTSLEDASTKDSTGDWQEQECTAKNWDVSADALVVDQDSAAKTAFDILDAIGTTVTLKFMETEGDKNRTAKTAGKVKTGKAIISDVTLTATNKQNASYSVTFTGIGALTNGD